MRIENIFIIHNHSTKMDKNISKYISNVLAIFNIN